MTTRITLAILLTTWVILIVGETAAFLTARQSLLQLFDDTIITARRRWRRRRPARDARCAGQRARAGTGSRSATRRTLPVASGVGTPQHAAQDAAAGEFETDAERQARSQGHGATSPSTSDGRQVRYLATYSRAGRTSSIALLSHLAWTLLLISLACGLATAWLALKLSRAALRPLHEDRRRHRGDRRAEPRPPHRRRGDAGRAGADDASG